MMAPAVGDGTLAQMSRLETGIVAADELCEPIGQQLDPPLATVLAGTVRA